MFVIIQNVISRTADQARKKINGFTLVELLVVIALIGILATIGVVSFRRVQVSARDSQRSAKITVLAEALEKFYDKNGEYPNCDAMSQSVSAVATNTLTGIRQDALTAPSGDSGTNSILALCGDLSVGTDAFAYVGDGDIPCLSGTGSTSACEQYTLKYLEESTNSVVSINSRHRIAPIDPPAAPTVTVTLNGGNILATVSSVTCSDGTVQYRINNRLNDGTWVGYTSWSTTTTATQVANAGVKYGYQAQARCYDYAARLSSAATSPEGTYTTAINTPAAPVVTSNTVTTTTTWSWPDVTCTAGTTDRYQYRFTYYSYDSNWVGQASNSFAATTSVEGYIYALSVQAQCYNTITSSAWSTSGSSSYTRPVSTPAAPTNWTITREDNNHTPPVYLDLAAVTSGCSAGPLTLYAQDDMKTFSWPWTDVGVNGWYAATHSLTWANTWYTHPTIVGIASNTKDIPTGKQWQYAVQLKCVNYWTGVESAPTARIEGTILAIP